MSDTTLKTQTLAAENNHRSFGFFCLTLRHSHPITDSGDDGVQVLDVAFQQHHPRALSAVRVWMVQQHVEEITELGRDAAVLEG